MSTAAARRIRRRERAALRHWLACLRVRAEVQVEADGGFRGRVRPAQRAASRLLDSLELRRQQLVEAAA